MKEVLIAAYNRDYHYWIQKLNKNIKVSVYRKGDDLNIPDEIYIENNVGRDVHTYFYHIVNNYENLADYTLTAQDYCFDHVSNYIDIINGDTATFNSYAKQSFQNGCWFFCTSLPVLKCDKFGNPHHEGLDLENAWNIFFKGECPDALEFTPTGHFCITKEHAHKRPLSFYKKILNFLETDKNAPWIIERLEPYIFNINYDINE
jgi:hypothetical protein